MATPPLRTAVVTGASSGIGRELVRQLVRDRNMNVLATARRRDRLELLAAEFPEGRVSIIDGDLGRVALMNSFLGATGRVRNSVRDYIQQIFTCAIGV